MEVNYYFSNEYDLTEKERLGKKAEWFLNSKEVPDSIIKPKLLLYDEEGRVAGYTYDEPSFPFLTLKELFAPQNIIKYHIDGRKLLLLAKKVLALLMELSEKRIYAGFISLDVICVHRERPEKAVFITHPELFQAAGETSDFPWYPSDSKLFEEEPEFFDERTQQTADAKLIYKILTASEKNNAKIPPNKKTQEYSDLFWNILSREWKEYFVGLKDQEAGYKAMYEMICRSLENENYYTDPKDKQITTEPDKKSGPEHMKVPAYAVITVLRESEKSAHDASREVYLLQERLEEHPVYSYEQAFVLGDRHPFVRGFQKYGKGFRSQLPHRISAYSYGEVLLAAAEVLEQALNTLYKPSELYIVLDGEIRKDAMFLASIERLTKLKKTWNTKITILPAGEFKGEGYRMLCEKIKG